MKTILILSFVSLTGAFINSTIETDEQKLQWIQRILKPSEADQHMLDELHDRISKAERVCRLGKCKYLRDRLVAGQSVPEFIRLLKEYDECMDDCRKKARKEYELLKEVERKEDYWKNLIEIRNEMSLKDAVAYWRQIQPLFKNLVEEEGKFQLVKAMLRYTEAEERRMQKLDRQIRKQDYTCKTGQCAPKNELLKLAQTAADRVRFSTEFFECMKECKKVVEKKERQLDKLKKKGDYLRNVKEIREKMSVLDALIYFDEIRSDIGLID